MMWKLKSIRFAAVEDWRGGGEKALEYKSFIHRESRLL
jgi:hypothetical protein